MQDRQLTAHDEASVAGVTAVQQSSTSLNSSTVSAELYPTALAIQLSHHLGSTVALSNQQPDCLTSSRVNATFESTKGITHSSLLLKKKDYQLCRRFITSIYKV